MVLIAGLLQPATKTACRTVSQVQRFGYGGRADKAPRRRRGAKGMVPAGALRSVNPRSALRG
jgi:hypothetical protein